MVVNPRLNLGFKVGDLLETKNPVWLERAGDYYTIRYGSRGRPRSKFAHKRIAADHPYRRMAEKRGWKKNLVKLDKLVGLVVSIELTRTEEEAKVQNTGAWVELLVSGDTWRFLTDGCGEGEEAFEWKPV